jgi:hypothetical protein
MFLPQRGAANPKKLPLLKDRPSIQTDKLKFAPPSFADLIGESMAVTTMDPRRMITIESLQSAMSLY